MEKMELPQDREQLVLLLEECDLKLGNIRFAISAVEENLRHLENSLLKTKIEQQKIKKALDGFKP